MTQENWGWANQATARALEAIGRLGGPRCCKRDTRLALQVAAGFIGEVLGVGLETMDINHRCHHHQRNRQCLKERCPYYPGIG